MKLQNEEVTVKKHLKPWLMNWKDQCTSKKLLKKTICIIVKLVTLKMLKYSMAYTIKFHWWWGDVLSREQEIVTRKILERSGPGTYISTQKMLIERWIFYEPDEIEIRLAFYRSFSTFRNIFGDLCKFFNFYTLAWGKRWLKKSFMS